MLRFYGYFKQGSEGPCKGRRPAFWDVVGKAKYDAWKRLGDLPRERAMESYVEELRKIVETMSFTQNVAEFYSSLSRMQNVSVSDLELVAPEVIRSKSEQNSPLHERREDDVQSNNSDNDDIPNAYTAPTNAYQNGHTHSNSTSDSSDDDEYIDTVEVKLNLYSRIRKFIAHIELLQDEIQVEHTSRPREKNYSHLNGGIHKKVKIKLAAATKKNIECIKTLFLFQVLPMTEVTNKLNIDQSLMTHLVQSITDNMKVDLQQVNSRLNALEQKVREETKKKFIKIIINILICSYY